MHLTADDMTPWLRCIANSGGQRPMAGCMHSICEFFKLRGTMHPPEALQLVAANFTKHEYANSPSKYYMSVIDNGFETSTVKKLADYGERKIPLDDLACSVCEHLFSEEGLKFNGLVMRFDLRSTGAPGLQDPL